MSEPPIDDIPPVSGPDYPHSDGPAPLPLIKGYKIIKQLGEGGMGIVYLAEQTEPIKRKVAIKIIKLGMDSKEVIARFEAEKQTLAQLDHPNIAYVYDAGTTEKGRPYFVMEYINGVPITDYCDQQRLSIEERLGLFKQVCEGIQHAHQRGIIHRDIKPSNILILTEEGKAIPKVIDFGVAKAIRQELTEQTMFTAQGQLIGTPEYMSPEQADLTNNNIDTRTDVYSLGVVLYQLLTGALPFDSQTLRKAAFAEIQRIIKEENPPKPSTKLSSLGKEAQGVAETRRTSVGRLTQRLHKELEWIPLKAMRKESDHRYQSVSELAGDIQNYLNGSPLLAGPELARYRLKKFISRNKTLVVSGLAVTIVLIVGIITTSTLAIKLTYSKAKTQRVLEDTTTFLQNDLMGSLSGEHEDIKQVDIVSVLNAASRHLSHRFKDNPLAEAKIRTILGLWYNNLGMYQKAEELLDRCMKICQEEYGQDHRETLGAMNNLALVYINQNDYEKAEELLTVALDKGSKYLEKNDPWLWNFIGNLAKTYHKQGEDEKAEQLHVKLLQLLNSEMGPEHRETLGHMNDAALFYMDCNNYEKAEELLVKSLEVGRRKLKEDDPWLTNFISNLAKVYTHQKRYNEAEKLYIEALNKKQRFLGKSNQAVLCLMHTIAHFYEKQGRYEDAKAILTEAVEIGTRQYGQDDEHTTRHRNCLYRLINNKNISPDINIQKPQQSAGLNEIFIGKPFPQLEFNDLKGNVVNIGKLKGKALLIDFWATWCGPCTAETPNLISVYNEFKDKGLEVIGISLDNNREELNDYLEEQKIQWPNYYDGKIWDNEISSRFGIHGIPEIILIDRQGIVRETGLRGDRIREAVSQLIKGDFDSKGIIKKEFLPSENQLEITAPSALPPVIDGVVGANEWSTAGKLPLPHGTLYAQHDNSNLYLLVDLTEDTFDDPASAPLPDYFWLTFDVDRNAIITPNVDIDYAFANSSLYNFGLSYCLGPNKWTRLLSTISKLGVGFGPSPSHQQPHRIWEFAISLSEIKAGINDVVRAGLRTSSQTPFFKDDIPPSFASDFSNLIRIWLKPVDAAIEAYKQAIDLKPDNANAHYNLGAAYLNLGDKDSALKEYETLKTLDKNMANELLRTINKDKLIQAAENGNLPSVQTLLANSADVNTKRTADANGTTALMKAAKEGHTDVVKLLLENGADVNAVTNTGGTALMAAAWGGHTEIVKLLLEKGADIDAKDTNGLTTLMVAAYSGHIETVKPLLEKGADVNAKDTNGVMALMWPAWNGNIEIVKLLLDKGADVNAKNKDGLTALWFAACYGHTEIVNLLLDKGADVADLNAKYKDGLTTLMWPAWNGNTETVKLLLDKGADVNAKDTEGETALIYASSSNGKTEIIRLLLEKGADINAKRTTDGVTALIKAAYNGHTGIVKLLLENGADVNAKNKDGLTALWFAACYGHTEIVNLLLDKGADVADLNAEYKGETVLMYALGNGKTEIVKLLLEKGADVNAKNNEGKTALWLAAENGQTEIVKLLLEKGADVNVKIKANIMALMTAVGKDYPAELAKLLKKKANINVKETVEGITVLMTAAGGGHTETVRLLLENGANVNAKTTIGGTALMAAAVGGHTETVKLLLEKGADINVKDNIFGATALWYATYEGHTEMVKLLLEKGAKVNAKATGYGVTTLMVAAVKGHTETVKLLLEKGANVNAKTTKGTTALMLAAEYGNVETVKLLLEKGANVNAKATDNGTTALMTATGNGYIEVVKLLLEKGADVNAKAKGGITAMMIAEETGHIDIVQLLEKAGAKE